MNWQPIETAPKDGRPVWVKGNNWGKPNNGTHCCWAWFDGDEWKSAECGEHAQGTLSHLTHWMQTT